MMKKVLMNWSGGKDSSLCLHHLLRSEDYEVVGLLTSINEAYNRVSMHGVRKSLIQKQAESIGLPLHVLQIPENVTMDGYNRLMKESLEFLKEDGVEYCAFGDIFLENLRTHREEKLAAVGIKGVFPLWNRSTQKLARQFIDSGFKSVLSAVDGSKLGKKFAGREYNEDLLNDLPTDVDACGEYGEFHSFVFDGPIFKQPIDIERGEIVERVYKLSDNSDSHSFSPDSDHKSSSFWFIDLCLTKS